MAGKFRTEVWYSDNTSKLETVEGYKNDRLGIYYCSVRNHWVILHLGLMRSYAHVESLDCAAKVVETVGSWGWKGFRASDLQEFIDNTPRWLIQWCKRMIKTRRYEDHERWRQATKGA